MQFNIKENVIMFFISAVGIILLANCNDSEKLSQKDIHNDRLEQIHYFKDDRVSLCFGYTIAANDWKGTTIFTVPCTNVENMLSELPELYADRRDNK